MFHIVVIILILYYPNIDLPYRVSLFLTFCKVKEKKGLIEKRKQKSLSDERLINNCATDTYPYR